MKELRLGTKLAIDEDVKFDKMEAAERYAPSPACASADPVRWRAADPPSQFTLSNAAKPRA
jgi:hypothetical protein